MNPRQKDYDSSALPLSYTANESCGNRRKGGYCQAEGFKKNEAGRMKSVPCENLYKSACIFGTVSYRKGHMNSPKKNRIFVTLFLLFMMGFTCLMTFYVGPIMMATRDQVAQDQVLFKCQNVINCGEIEVQMRGWERPNLHPVFDVTFAGLDTPPPGGSEDPDLIAWANARNLDPAFAAKIGESSHKTLLAFIRKQNLFLYREDGTRSSHELQEGSRVHVMVSGTNVNLKQLESGLALHDTSRPHAFFDEYAAAEAQAKAAGKGLWATN